LVKSQEQLSWDGLKPGVGPDRLFWGRAGKGVPRREGVVFSARKSWQNSGQGTRGSRRRPALASAKISGGGVALFSEGARPRGVHPRQATEMMRPSEYAKTPDGGSLL